MIANSCMSCGSTNMYKDYCKDCGTIPAGESSARVPLPNDEIADLRRQLADQMANLAKIAELKEILSHQPKFKIGDQVAGGTVVYVSKGRSTVDEWKYTVEKYKDDFHYWIESDLLKESEGDDGH